MSLERLLNTPDLERIVPRLQPEVLHREPSSSAFSQFLFSKGWVLNLEEYRNNPERYENLLLPTWLTQASRFWLIVPLIVSDEPIGFVALGLARTRIDVN